MYINELAPGTPLKLSAKVKGETYDFQSEVITAYKEPRKGMYCIGCQPIVTENNKLLSFGSMPLNVIATNPEDNRQYKFITQMQGFSRDKKEYLIFSGIPSQPINYRGAYRVPCNYDVTLQIGSNRHTSKGHVHDISFTGISFIFLTEYFKNVDVGSNVSASIHYGDNNIARITGKVVRYIENFMDGISLIGVEFESTTNAVISLIAELQRKELRIRKKQQK